MSPVLVTISASAWGKSESYLPLRPLPSEVEVAQMVREPIHEPVEELNIQGIECLVQKPDSTTKARCYRARCKLACLCDDGVIVDQLVLWYRELQHQGEDGIDGKIFRLPCRFALRCRILNLVKEGCTLDESVWCPVAVEINEVLGGNVAIEVKCIYCISQSIANE